MANATVADVGPKNYDQSPQNYTSLGNLVTATKDDVRDLYVATFGDQGITGLLDITGAKRNAGTADETVWFEEGRLNRLVSITLGATNPVGTVTAIDGVSASVASKGLRPYDVLLGDNDMRVLVTAVNASSATFTYLDMSTKDKLSATLGTATTFAVIGNAYPQGSDQPSSPFEVNIQTRRNPFIIVKETFHVNGSQASNIGWVNVNGRNMWYLKGEMDARRKFLKMREAMLVFGQLNTGTYSAGATYGASVTGSEGYFAAVENRGITTDTAFANDMTFGATNGLDSIILQMDYEGSPAENAMYLNRQLSLNIDSMLGAAGLGGGGIGAAAGYGAFNNSKDMAINLGFKSFTRGGYTFHKHDWKMLNDPTVAGNGLTKYRGAIIPLGSVVDPKTGASAPSLEMNYKGAGNYSRELEHWVEGGGVLGYATGSEDKAKFHYRSECNLCVRAANQHVAFV